MREQHFHRTLCRLIVIDSHAGFHNLEIERNKRPFTLYLIFGLKVPHHHIVFVSYRRTRYSSRCTYSRTQLSKLASMEIRVKCRRHTMKRTDYRTSSMPKSIFKARPASPSSHRPLLPRETSCSPSAYRLCPPRTYHRRAEFSGAHG